jgi:hypothetical protein
MTINVPTLGRWERSHLVATKCNLDGEHIRNCGMASQ